MAKKSNKTSHVLNLITGSGPEAESQEEGVVSGEPTATPAPSISPEAAASLEAASEEHAAALRENTAALLENAAALRENAAAVPETPVAASTESAPSSEGSSRMMSPDEIAALLAQANAESESAAPATPTPEAAPNVPLPTAQPEQKVIVIDETSENDKLSNTIMNSLADHLEQMEGKSVEEAEAEPESVPGEIEAEPVSTEESIVEEKPALDTTEEASSEGSSRMMSPDEIAALLAQANAEPEESKPAPVPAPKAEPEPVKEPETAYHMINVMEQILRRQNLLKQMNDYGVCTCSRCQTDVLALCLTKLPSKYVVVDKSSTAPIIGYYESKFKIRIFTEIMKACIKVKDDPRHEL